MPKPNARLKQARMAAGYTQAQLAERAGIPLGTYKTIEAGYKTGRLPTVLKIARALGLTVEDLFAPENDPKRNAASIS